MSFSPSDERDRLRFVRARNGIEPTEPLGGTPDVMRPYSGSRESVLRGERQIAAALDALGEFLRSFGSAGLPGYPRRSP